MASPAANKGGRPRLPASARKQERAGLRLSAEDEKLLRQLGARRGEVDSDTLRAGLRALDREHVLDRVLQLLHKGQEREAVAQLQELLDRRADGAADTRESLASPRDRHR